MTIDIFTYIIESASQPCRHRRSFSFSPAKVMFLALSPEMEVSCGLLNGNILRAESVQKQDRHSAMS